MEKVILGKVWGDLLKRFHWVRGIGQQVRSAKVIQQPVRPARIMQQLVHPVKMMFLLAAAGGWLSVAAQPSGGPYGPVNQSWPLPKTAGKIIYVAPDGNSQASGDQLAAPTTIENAISKAMTGDVLILRGGIYRSGDLEFNQGITIQPYNDEQPVFKGTQVVTQWQRLRGNLWKTPWKTLFRAYPDDWWVPDRHGMRTPLHVFNNDMVFVDGRLLHSAGWPGEVDENSFFIDYEKGFVYIGTDPENRLVEITAHNRAFFRVLKDINGRPNDHKGVIMRGITLTQYAYAGVEIDARFPDNIADPSTFGKDVVGSLFEHCTFSFCGRVGGYLHGDQMVMRHCKVHDTVTEGIFIQSSNDCLLERNIFSRNNIENISGYYPAAVKIFNQTHRIICRDNLVCDQPLSNGIWYDVGNVDGQFLNNWVKDVGTNRGGPANPNATWVNYNGFFFEISKGVVCAGNLFENCDQGVSILNASNAVITQNTFVNSPLVITRDTRGANADHFGWHISTGPGVDQREGHQVFNNLMVGTDQCLVPLMKVIQHPDLCGKLTRPQLTFFDYNIFVQDPDGGQQPLMEGAPVPGETCQMTASDQEALQKLFDGAAQHTLVVKQKNTPLFKGLHLGNYTLNPAFTGAAHAMPLPVHLREMLSLPVKYKSYPGCYPLK
jgi:hypothetical protein